MKGRSRSGKVLAIAISVVLTLVGLEVGSRVVDRVRGKPWVADQRRKMILGVVYKLSSTAFTPGAKTDEEGKPVGEGAILQPYAGWEHPSTQEMLARDIVYYRDGKSERNYDVCILGGSVAQAFAGYGANRLTEILSQDPRLKGRPISIHNYACAGFKQPQQSMVLAYLLVLGHRPDAVVEIDGFNEAALGWNNAKIGTNPLYPSTPHWAKATHGTRSDPEMVEHLHDVRTTQERARKFGEWFLASGWWRSCFLEHVASLRLESLRMNYVRAYQSLMEHLASRPKDAEMRGPRFRTDDEGIEEAVVRFWMETSISMHGMCKERGITYLHVLQPTLRDPGARQPTPKEEELATSDPLWVEGVVRLYPKLRDAGPRLAERGIPFCDASGVFRDRTEDIYYDVCHFKELGNDLLAIRVGEALRGAMKP
jgi:hypothetical protein